MKKHTVLKAFVVILLLVFIVHQAYSALYNPTTTQNAEFYTANDGITVDAVAVRHEQLVTSSMAGALHFKSANGTRVSKGGTIAEIYNDSSASITVSQMDELTEKIADIEEISGYNDVAAADLNLVNDKVISALDNFIYGNSTGRYTSAEKDAYELLSAENRKQFITGETVDFSAKLASLKGKLDSLKSKLPAPIGFVRAEKSGYFVSATDGYEQQLSALKAEDITPELLEGLKAEQIDENVIGKIVYDYDWYIAASVKLGESLKYKVGDELTVKTTVRNNETLTVRVEAINPSGDSDKAVLVLSSGEMNSDIAMLRSASITIVSTEYSGLKVDKRAMRVVKGKPGVYVVSGISIKFVPIKVIYSTDSYVLCEQVNENGKKALKLYDEVVVKGKNLYDGKIIS